MNAENVKSQMRKGTLEYCILLLLKKEPRTNDTAVNSRMLYRLS